MSALTLLVVIGLPVGCLGLAVLVVALLAEVRRADRRES